MACSNKSSSDDIIKRHRMLPKIEKLALDRFCTIHKITSLSVVREVKFSDGFIGIDPIMDRNAVFDAYYKSVQEEIFIEVKLNFNTVSMMYNLYYLLSKVYYYRQANQLHAKMALIVPILPESYGKERWHPEACKVITKLQETFAPAIKNNLLEIVPIEITQTDLDLIAKELETEERSSGG